MYIPLLYFIICSTYFYVQYFFEVVSSFKYFFYVFHINKTLKISNRVNKKDQKFMIRTFHVNML